MYDILFKIHRDRYTPTHKACGVLSPRVRVLFIRSVQKGHKGLVFFFFMLARIEVINTKHN